MKIAVATDDERTVSQHLAKARLYLVFDVEAGTIKGKESRPKVSHRPDRGALHQRGNEASLREDIVSNVRDCEVIIAGGMGKSMYDAIIHAGIKPFVTDETQIDVALGAYVNGTLVDRPPLEGALLKVALEGMKDEAKDRTIYEGLAEAYKGSDDRYSDAFSALAATEQKHYDFWRKYTAGREAESSRPAIFLVRFLKRVFGTTFAIRFLERHEARTIERYKAVAQLIPEEDRDAFQEIITDESSNERSLRDKVEGSYVKYISFVILGLADAIVEISGIHAGSLGIYNSTEITGLAGIVAGGAASIAMASAAYAQAKQGFRGSASVSATFTGVSYFTSATILAGPYFLTKMMMTAMAASLTFGVVMIIATSYFNSVITERRFLKDSVELVAIMLLATVVLYIFGEAVRIYAGITL